MFIPGGASAPWFFPEQVDLPMEGRAIGGAGSMLGSGAIVVMDETTDAVKACLRVVRFFARESCGKCTPCREGTTWEEKILQRILDGHGRPDDIDLLLDVADNISPGPYPVAARSPSGPRGRAVPAAADHDLPARAVVGGADHLRHPPVPPRVRGEDHQAEPDPRRLRVARAPALVTDGHGGDGDGADDTRPRGGAQPCLSGRARSRSPTRSTITVDGRRSPPRRASWSSTRASGTARTSRASATTRA